MKNLLSILLLSLFALPSGFGHQIIGTDPGDAQSIKFMVTKHDFGTVEHHQHVTYSFKFVNDGKEPVSLTKVKASCGCTVPSYTKGVVMPGDTGVVSATFKSPSIGKQTKSVTVNYGDGANKKSVQLLISANVIAKPADNTGLPTKKNELLIDPK